VKDKALLLDCVAKSQSWWHEGLSMYELVQPMQTDCSCTAFTVLSLECTGKSAWRLLHTLLNKLPVLMVVSSRVCGDSGSAAGLFGAECLNAHEFACRYKQAFQQPYAATAALNYYRAYIDVVTTRPSPAFHRLESQPCIMTLQD